MVLAGTAVPMTQDKAKTDMIKCAGLNECKGKGFLETKNAQEYADKGGSQLASFPTLDGAARKRPSAPSGIIVFRRV